MYDIVVLSFALLTLGSRARNLCAQSHVRIVNFEELKFLVLDIHRDIIAIAIEFSTDPRKYKRTNSLCFSYHEILNPRN